MKLINKTLAVLLACSGMVAAQAGNFEWRTLNLSSATFTESEINAVILQGLKDADANLPSLPKPWYLRFTVGLSSNATNYKAEPSMIIVAKARETPSGREEIACAGYVYGVYTKNDFFEALRERAAFNARYMVESKECVVNEPTAEPTPAPTPTKKASKK